MIVVGSFHIFEENLFHPKLVTKFVSDITPPTTVPSFRHHVRNGKFLRNSYIVMPMLCYKTLQYVPNIVLAFVEKRKQHMHAKFSLTLGGKGQACSS